jgi:autotransporter-associated beta strand protein
MSNFFIIPVIRYMLSLTVAITVVATPVARADQVKANNNNDLASGTSWVNGSAPGSGDNAVWDSTVATPANCTNLLGSVVTWGGIVINNPSAPVVINGNTTLTLNNGINLGDATENLTVNCGTISLGANQTWNVPSGRTLTTGGSGSSGSVNSPNNGNLIVTKTGGGVWTTSGTGDNGSTGVIINDGTVNLNKTSSSGAHAVGGPGLVINNGTARITGTGGDQIYDGGLITLAAGGTFDLNGNSETIATLGGSGGVVDNTAPGQSATLTLVNGNSIFSGTIQNSGSGATLAVVKNGAGTFTLSGSNTYTGGTTVNSGTLALTTTANVSMPYTINGGTLAVSPADSISSLSVSSLSLGSASPQLTFNFSSLHNLTAPLINDSGNVAMNGNVPVNVQNIVESGTYVLLQYGNRSGSGSFIAGSLPAGATITDDTVDKEVTLTYASLLAPRVIIPTLNTNEVVVAVTTPQEFGAVADGVTDDSAAFQNAMNAVYNSGGSGGGVVYVPPGNYAFYTNIVIPTGVTLHGDWTDWTKGTNGIAGTTFEVYFGSGQSNATPFITMDRSAALKDVNLWYPNQNPDNIVAYPFTIGLSDDCVVQDVALVNSYQGILCQGAEFILSSVIGTPLFMGLSTTGTIADICQTEDIRFSPGIWPASLLPNAPTVGGSYATWMRTYGTGIQVFRLDGLINNNTEISGYHAGLDFEMNSGGASGCAFYDGWVTNCAIAMLAQEMQTAAGLEVSDFTLDGDIAIERTHATNDAAAEFDHCQIIGRNGTAVSCIGADWQSSMAFQNCTISNALDLAGPGVFNLVNCQLLGSTQCVMSAAANRVAFTGCRFSPSRNIINDGNTNNLLIDPRPAISYTMPAFHWTNMVNRYLSCRPAKTNLYVVTDAPWGAYGDGIHDDTEAIQSALTAAGTNGGGIVYIPPGQYRVTNTLDVPSGVELCGPYELRHGTWPGADGIAKGAILQPYGGQSTTDGPPAIALEANSGLVGMTISYESQWTNCFPFPPTIQGRGPNIYMIGVQCPNPYYYVDLDTYTCTNHFIYMLDGWALKTGVKLGNGSSGTIADCHANWTFWIDNFGAGQNQLSGSSQIQAPVEAFVMSNLEYYVLGNCSELFVKDFSIIENKYMHCIPEDGIGPTVTGISAMCDATYQCFVFDSMSSCTFNDVNPEWLVSLNGGYPGLTNQAVILTKPDFQGTVRLFNSPTWGPHNWDYIINGGDVAVELAHLWQYAYQGIQVNGGVFHLVNCGAFNPVDGGSGTLPYNLTFGPDAGVQGETNEVIGSFSYAGWNVADDNVTTPADVWMDYAISSYNVLNLGPVRIGDIYPEGVYQFEPSSGLSFMTYSPYGINPNDISVALTQTNLLGQGRSMTYTTANGLVVSGTNGITVTAPLVTNMLYNAVIQVTDANGNTGSNTLSFDTVNPAFTFEAEDFDYNGGHAFVNPLPDAYAGLSGMSGIDYSNGIPGQGSASYRPQGLETEGAGDKPRASYGGQPDYDIGFANVGNWGNYTRQFPSGAYNIYARVASPNLPGTQAIGLAQVTSGQGTTTQTTSSMGTFPVPNTGGWQTYVWTPLLDGSGHPYVFQSGSVETLRATQLKGGYNVNYYMLVSTNSQLIPPQGSVMLQLAGQQSSNNPSIIISWPGSIDDAVTNLYWTPSLTPPVKWTLVQNAPAYTNGQWIVTLPAGTNTAGFYRLQQ